LYGDWRGITTAIYLDGGEHELMIDQITAMSHRLRDQGIEHEYNLVKYGQHIPSFASYWIPEADEAMDKALAFIVRHLHAPSSIKS
jgi:acetyl esterase/lipase